MEFGKVKFFNAEKRFGFIQTKGGEEIFFHFNDGEMIIPKSEPEFSGDATTFYRGRRCHLRDPQRDDQVVFLRGLGNKGDKATPWGFRAMYDKALEIISYRPKIEKNPSINIIEKRQVRLVMESNPGGIKEIWTGESREDCPGVHWDPKYDGHPFSCGDFTSIKYWQELKNGEWVKINL